MTHSFINVHVLEADQIDETIKTLYTKLIMRAKKLPDLGWLKNVEVFVEEVCNLISVLLQYSFFEQQFDPL